jgi:uncharacterized repeat protein (TIGR01451 family)
MSSIIKRFSVSTIRIGYTEQSVIQRDNIFSRANPIAPLKSMLAAVYLSVVFSWLTSIITTHNKFRKQYELRGFLKIVPLTCLFFLPILTQASTLDWDVEVWPASALTQTYTNVDGSGVDITVTMTGDTARFDNGTPVSLANRLDLSAQFNTATETILTTIVFSSPVKLSNIRIRDIDFAANDFDDRIIISGKNTAGTTVLPNDVIRGSNINENTPGDYEADTLGVGDNDARSFLTFSFDDVAITEFSFQYTNGASVPADPDGQHILLNNIEFFLSTPSLTIDKTSTTSSGTVVSGDTITYTIEVENDAAASGDATNVVLSDILPTGVTYVSSSALKTYPNSTTSTYTSPNLGPANVDGVTTETLSFNTTGVLPVGAILDTYRFDVSGDSLGASWHSEIDLIATYPGGTAFTLDFGDDLGFPNNGGAYSVTQGPTNVSGTAIGVYQFIWTEDFDDPDDDNAVSNATFTIEYFVPTTTTDAANAPVNMVTAADNITLKPGEKLTVTFDVTVDAGVSSGTLTNTATANSNETSAISDTAVDTVVTTPVTLSSFQALSGDVPGAVNFHWTTATEVGNIAFNLYQRIDGEWVLINDQPIPSHVIDSIQTQHYSYQADELDSGIFGIEDIDLYGTAVMHGTFQLNQSVGISNQQFLKKRRSENLRSSPQSTKLLKSVNQQTPKSIDWEAIGLEHRNNKQERKFYQQEQMIEKMNQLNDEAAEEDLSVWTDDLQTPKQQHIKVAYQQSGWVEKVASVLAAFLISPAQAAPELITTSESRQIIPSALTQTVSALTVPKQQLPKNVTELMNLSVQTTGIYRVTYEQLLAEGLDLSRIKANWITLRNQGQQVPITVHLPGTEEEDGEKHDAWHSNWDGNKQGKRYRRKHQQFHNTLRSKKFGEGSYIEFYGEAINSLYTDRNIYTLSLNKSGGLRSDIDNSAIPASAALSYFMSTVIVEPKGEYSFANPGDDPWYSKRILAFNTKTVALPITLEGYVANPDPHSWNDAIRYSVSLWGGLDFPGNSTTQPDHHVIVAINGEQHADETFDGIINREITGTLASIKEGLNTISVTLPADTSYFADLVNIEKWQITYPKHFHADGSGLVFRAAGTKYQVTGLDSDELVVYRRADNGALTKLNTLDIDCVSSNDCRVGFAGDGQLADYFVKTVATTLTPGAFEPVPEYDNIKTGKAELLIISSPDFINELYGSEAILNPNQSYASVKIVDVETIYAQFGDHLVDAHAIDDYIQYAYQHLRTRHVLIVGGDSYDPNGYLGLGAISFVPTLYTATDNLIKWAPVDALYGDVDGDFIPDLAIGRLPVRTQAELQTILAKIQDYYDRDYDKTVVFASDAFEVSQNYDFKADAQTLIADHFSEWQVTRAHIDDLGSSAAHTQLIDSINAGVSLTGFIGHSAPSQWTFNTPPLLKATDLAALTNSGKPTVVAQLGCWNTYYVSPHEDTMGHQFMLNGDRGAVAVLGASTLTKAVSERLLAKEIFARLQTGVLLGDAILEGKRAYARSNQGQKDVLLGWTLLGHPGLIM